MARVGQIARLRLALRHGTLLSTLAMALPIFVPTAASLQAGIAATLFPPHSHVSLLSLARACLLHLGRPSIISKTRQVEVYAGPGECADHERVANGSHVLMHYTGTIDASSKGMLIIRTVTPGSPAPLRSVQTKRTTLSILLQPESLAARSALRGAPHHWTCKLARVSS